MQLSAVAVLDREPPVADALDVLERRTTSTSSGPHASTPPVSRRGLIGMGVAGGLVPSPSALIVLLSAIALGRTAFGVLLVVGYGLGMAATLTLAGLFLVRASRPLPTSTCRRVADASRAGSSLDCDHSVLDRSPRDGGRSRSGAQEHRLAVNSRDRS